MKPPPLTYEQATELLLNLVGWIERYEAEGYLATDRAYEDKLRAHADIAGIAHHQPRPRDPSTCCECVLATPNGPRRLPQLPLPGRGSVQRRPAPPGPPLRPADPRREGAGVSGYRTGRKVGRTLYKQVGRSPSDDDQLIGVLDTPELALYAADAMSAADAGMVYLVPTLDQLAAHLSEARRERGMSVRQVAAVTGTSASTVSRVERGYDVSLSGALALLQWATS